MTTRQEPPTEGTGPGRAAGSAGSTPSGTGPPRARLIRASAVVILFPGLAGAVLGLWQLVTPTWFFGICGLVMSGSLIWLAAWIFRRPAEMAVAGALVCGGYALLFVLCPLIPLVVISGGLWMFQPAWSLVWGLVVASDLLLLLPTLLLVLALALPRTHRVRRPPWRREAGAPGAGVHGRHNDAR